MQGETKLACRYSFFSGDDPNTAISEKYDPLFFGLNRGDGTWIQGDVAGNFAGPVNSNTGVHNVQFTLQPTETLKLGALYFNFKEDEEETGRLHNFDAQEFDLFFYRN